MQERRKNDRIPFEVSLVVDSLFKQNNTKLDNLDAKISVYDISIRGIGFSSKADLPVDFYFDTKISFDEDNHFLTVLRIIRKEEDKDGFNYGCEFVGLADNLALIIQDYAKTQNS